MSPEHYKLEIVPVGPPACCKTIVCRPPYYVGHCEDRPERSEMRAAVLTDGRFSAAGSTILRSALCISARHAPGAAALPPPGAVAGQEQTSLSYSKEHDRARTMGKQTAAAQIA
eukprot:CAMPEP_0181237746 /NCGR_PEP_ID=MMETSP1096-20121128/38941_1 /TAXON_ID=156174 ORGANISM="Chrysochromulina ericina, Strain CCMP281" /NCGR_SAMPLE_ID=MMETSP1096 /ASSEMBLY_ACC=CAM_ASM_000453 /LENGTH=113 /DNA_ID=CAMNT_0023333149 /DNA_START=173 /DNA_END=512 /DNA_ORIENTATION=+